MEKRKVCAISFLGLSLVLCLCEVAKTAGWTQLAKLAASDGADSDWFGMSVSISGDYAIAAAINDDSNGSSSGSAYIFMRNGTNWNQQAKLVASDGAVDDFFGRSVSICPDYAIIGAYGDDDNGNTSGSAYIFVRNDTIWSQQAKLLASDGAPGDVFGGSVSISGDYAIIGAYYDDDKGNDSGAAYIFKREGTTWYQQAKLLAPDGAEGDNFGYCVSISGDYAVIGAYYDDDNGSDSGSAYIFKREGTTWTQQAKLLASDGAADDYFGYSVSIISEYVVVGSVFDDDNGNNSGSAYIFKRDETGWSQQAKLLASDGDIGDFFGKSVSIRSEHAIVGAYYKDDGGSNSGAAYIFKRDGTNWSPDARLLAFDVAAYDSFGVSVSIDNNSAVVGAYGDDDNGTNSGSAYMFSLCPGADLSNDCFVNSFDFAIIGSQWLQSTGFPSSDIAPDGVVDFLDLAVLAEQWLQDP